MAMRVLLLFVMMALPALAQEAAKATTYFDVPPGGILASLVTAIVTFMGTHKFMSSRQSRERQDVRITHQPVKIESVPGHISDPTCAATHKAVDGTLEKNQKDHDDIFPRLSKVEIRLGVLEGAIPEIRRNYTSIDDKLTAVLKRLK